ncbi:OmpW/AlkL family protein [Thalassotalea mangrovi]|uniref:Outer membrane protein OmpW n=1 Tax=Thalassotalea mangrovi TaxID=2572245 RepID=A0A4U1B7K2_9GAMM|nr:OmpW family outer membrane protein [Thalassotalea mangrovi]TKB46440.1 outer membrane protein OmpW [Thalassotalea mangrovi]
MKKQIVTMAVLTALLTPMVHANEAGDWVIRAGATNVDPDSGSSGVYVEALGGDTPLSVSVDDNTQLGLNFAYFFSPNWAFELLAATPFEHDVIINDPSGIAPGIFGVPVDGATLASVKHLPPTLSVLYYFSTAGSFQPYVGLGLNYTTFFEESFKSGPSSLGFNDLELDDSWGYSAQVGLDFYFSESWLINASARYIDIETDATFNIGEIAGSADVGVDPMVYSIMLGYKF